MDSITIAIAAAIAAGALSAEKKAGEQVVADSYDRLKSLLKSKCGARSKTLKAVADFEATPWSRGRQGVLEEEVLLAKADKDAELLDLAQQLLNAVKAQPNGEQIIQMAMGEQNG